ncbi:diaminopimelate decarboxylase [Chitinispirillales bacterium ANBcel5]|uniref:diaminopimelate decarboxylase family protein n=1 Tax=Cellulosispirillum alkaliphilum TaxID=3039283 RepID=UPI002A4FBF31|nr:diaminopimelate decarboxylase [Chitinispirillales bacterium ANBcel5]
MSTKSLPFNKEKIEEIVKEYPTPFHIYDEKGIRENARKLLKTFSWAPGFTEYFAVKANPNPYILKLFAQEGVGGDCSSYPELELSRRAGITGEKIMFTSNDTPYQEYQAARELDAIINLDDITHISYLEHHAGLPEIVCFRYNPGPLRQGNEIIGNPREAKYGFTRDQLFEGYKILRDKGVKRFGLHAMVASNELNGKYFVETAEMLYELVVEISQQLGIRFEFVNIGGGVGIPYRPEQKPVDLEAVSKGIKEAYERIIVAADLAPLKLYMECGRMMTGPYGFLVSRVLHEKKIYKDYVGLDATMANLMRPGLYGAYHHITVLGKENAPAEHLYDVTGSLCENNDKFAIDRKLPETKPGDLVVIHDTGAHGHAMGFNYNGKLRSAELLLREDGSVKQIRRAETLDDYFATLDFEGLSSF